MSTPSKKTKRTSSSGEGADEGDKRPVVETTMYGNLNNGLKIPLIGLGTGTFTDRSKVKNAIKSAIEIGYRMIDTAVIYGVQREVGEALKEIFAEGKIKREDIWITSKIWNDCHEPDRCRWQMQEILKDLQVSYVDLLHMHYPLAVKFGDSLKYGVKDQDRVTELIKVPLRTTWEVMESFVKDGYARSLGVSNFSGAILHDLLSYCTIKPAVIQIELHPYLQQPWLVQYCIKEGIHVTAYSSLLEGMGSTPTILNTLPPKPLHDEPAIAALEQKYNKSTAQILLRWGLQQQQKGGIGAVSIVPKSESRGHQAENFNIFDFTITPEELAAVEEIGERVKPWRIFNIWDAYGVPTFY